MSRIQIRALEGDMSRRDYESRKAKNECMSQGVFCIASIALFVFAGLMNTSTFIDSIPGGAVTTAIIGIGIFVCVLFLCIQQRPRGNGSISRKSIIAENQNCPP